MGIADGFWLFTGLESCPGQAESQLLLLEKVEAVLDSRVLEAGSGAGLDKRGAG